MTRQDTDLEATIDRIARAIDRGASIPVSVQLRGALEYGIGTGDVAAGTRLPSVRALAARLGLSPVTVSGVYAGLREAGYIEGRVGSGTFVTGGDAAGPARRAGLQELERRIAELVRLGQGLGLSPAEIALRVSSAGASPEVAGARRLRLLMLGTFRDATAFYAEEIRPHLAPGDTISALTVEEAGATPPGGFDLVVTPRTLTGEARTLFPDLPVVGITMIPTETTRVALATLPPEAQVAAVSYFDDFLTLMKTGIMRFAPHVTQVEALVRSDPELAARLAEADVLIHSTGAEYLRAGLRPDQTAIEYRHTPDGRAIRAELLPAIAACRAGEPQQEETRLEDHR
ncbi:GntR family transcriptional regulator [Limimaricola pyoseonensis]|uniref:Transcriptional regulator, GntR family n=1 Tax=Limimaricola pyoseonensis TaxID=521013 RepID=A0A1G7HLN2_9RHOB|nr:GntR family transcriptional regulator [Limimaricola pyoseonensis]SDF01308.1 transcriptional regulator, GntR family [Limimaricola pyoseonensis]